MAMTGMRAFTVSVGLVEEPPPRAILRQKCQGAVPRGAEAPAARRAASWRTGATAPPAGPRSLRCPTGSAGGRGAGPLYGLVLWLGFELVHGAAAGAQAGQGARARSSEAALAADHLLYGLVLSETRAVRATSGALTCPAGASGVRVRGPCRAWASGRTSTAWRRRRAWPAACSTTSAACCWRSRGPSGGRRLPRAPARRGAAARGGGAGRARDAGRHRRAAASRSSPASAAAAAGRAGVARRRHLRGLPVRELFDPADRRHRYPFVELHQLRAALHDRARGPLRPAAHHDGRLRDVRALPGRVRGSRRPPLPRPAERVPATAARALRLTDSGGRDVGLAGAIDAAQRRPRRSRRVDRGRQGPRRLPPGVPRPTTRAPSPRCARASTARTSRSR